MSIRRLAPILASLSLLLGGLLVRAPAARAAEACFAETGFCVRGAFLAYWLAHGGLAINGYPLTDERLETLEDGKQYVVQYFERVRLEHHPENPAPYDVLLGQFGRRLHPADPPAPAQVGPGVAYFEVTGHNVPPDFFAYWLAHGGLPQFGYPLSEVFEEQLEDGQRYQVQYFERARFERHPENAGTAYGVLLGQFGRRILTEVDLLTGRFAQLYSANPAVRARLGMPMNRERQVAGATQAFERGRMFYLSDMQAILVLCAPPPARWANYPNTFVQGQPEGGAPAPVAGLYEPKRGFGKVWRERPEVRSCVGYALSADEQATTLVAQPFAQGLLLSNPVEQAIYGLYYAGGSDGFPGGYERFDGPSR